MIYDMTRQDYLSNVCSYVLLFWRSLLCWGWRASSISRSPFPPQNCRIHGRPPFVTYKKQSKSISCWRFTFSILLPSGSTSFLCIPSMNSCKYSCISAGDCNRAWHDGCQRLRKVLQSQRRPLLWPSPWTFKTLLRDYAKRTLTWN